MAGYASDDENLRGVLNPDFLAIGLGGTSMMSMLWAVAMGRRAVGVEMRGDPFLGVHWNIRADFYHQLGLLDELMLQRYGDDRIPRRGDSDKRFRLAETLYSTRTKSGDIVADEVIDGFDHEQHIAGTIHHVEFIDDRWRDGVPSRSVTLLTPPEPPTEPDPSRIRTNMREVLDGPSTFQGGASTILVLLRRYLEKMEQLDLEGGYEPRVRLFTRHRVVNTPEGFDRLPDGRIGFHVEALQELDYRGKFVRIRRPGSKVIDIGVPALFMIAEGAHSVDAERLGFKQEDVVVDHHDGRGPVVAQADFLAGLVEVLVGGRLRRRISSAFDEAGTEYWIRQIAVGHEDDPEVGWCLVQVPDFKSFDPIAEGLVPEGTDPKSPEFFAAYENLLYDFYAEQVGETLELPADEVKKLQMAYGPKLFTLVEQMGPDALVAPNGVVAGDSFGNGHFLTSGGAMTGMIGHSWRVYEYYQQRDAGVPHEQAIRTLADRIKEDTQGWLHVSAREYSEAAPINFGAERIGQIEAQSGISSSTRAASIDATRRTRHSLLPLNPSDWRRLFLRNGKVYSAPLPELHAVHPALRKQQPHRKGERTQLVFVAPDLQPDTISFVDGVAGQLGVDTGLIAPGSADQLPDSLRDRLATFVPVENVHEPALIAQAVRSMQDALPRPERLLTSAEELQLPLAQAREQLGIGGISVSAARNLHEADRLREQLIAARLPVPRYGRIECVHDGLVFGTEMGYYPLIVKPNTGARADNTYRVDTEDELRELLERLQPTEDRPYICEELFRGRDCTLEVLMIGGIPTWWSATRFDPESLDGQQSHGNPLLITLPRELDDPAGPVVRRMGYSALKALGIETGLASIRWHQLEDGTPMFTHVSAGPPPGLLVTMMTMAHDANMHRVWGNTVLNGVFSPIPRLYAVGAVCLRDTPQDVAPDRLAELDALLRELGNDAHVELHAPQPGQPRSNTLGGDYYVLVRHAETAVVEDALRRIAQWVGTPEGALAPA